MRSLKTITNLLFLLLRKINFNSGVILMFYLQNTVHTHAYIMHNNNCNFN